MLGWMDSAYVCGEREPARFRGNAVQERSQREPS